MARATSDSRTARRRRSSSRPASSFTARTRRSSMSPRNAERIALVTGSNRGIGLEAARQLARRGFHAVIASRDEAKGRQAAEGIRAVGDKATFLSLDVGSSESIWTAARRFEQIADRLEVLINNAG